MQPTAVFLTNLVLICLVKKNLRLFEIIWSVIIGWFQILRFDLSISESILFKITDMLFKVVAKVVFATYQYRLFQVILFAQTIVLNMYYVFNDTDTHFLVSVCLHDIILMKIFSVKNHYHTLKARKLAELLPLFLLHCL